MSDFRLSRPAERDLEEIWESIARHNVAAAERFLERIQQAIRKLASMPALGSEHEFLRDKSLRVWLVKTYLIIYRPDAKPIEIVRIVRGSRDLTALFGPW